MSEPTSAQILGVLTSRYPHWQQTHGNAHKAIVAYQDAELLELRAKWLLTEAGHRYAAVRDKWEKRWAEQHATREQAFDRAYRLWLKQERGDVLWASERAFLISVLGNREEDYRVEDWSDS